MLVTSSSVEKVKKVWGMEDIVFTISENKKIIPHKNAHVYETAAILTTLHIGLDKAVIGDTTIILKKPYLDLFKAIVNSINDLWEQEIETAMPEELAELDIFIEHPLYPQSWFRPE